MEADALLGRLDTVRTDGATAANVERIRAALAALDEDLNTVLQRANEALERSAMPAEFEDIRRELSAIAAPLAAWNQELGVEARRVAEALEMIAEKTSLWSSTRDRPEISTAGRVVQRGVEESLESLGNAEARLRAWRARLLSTTDRVLARIASIDSAQEQLQAAVTLDRTSLLVPEGTLLWSRDAWTRLGDELPQVPREIRAYGERTWAYIKRDQRPLLAHVLLSVILLVALGRFASRARARLDVETAAPRTGRLLERP